MAIRKRGESFLVDITVNGKRHYNTFPTEEEAVIGEARMRLEALSNASPSVKKWTLGTAYNLVCESNWNHTKAARTAIGIGKRVLQYFGADTPIDSITTAWIDEWVGVLKQTNRSNATINRYTSALSVMIKYAITRREVSGVTQLPHIPHMKEPIGRIRYLEIEEEEALLSKCRQLGFEAQADLFAFLLDTGARIGEALKLKAEDCVIKESFKESLVIFKDRKSGRTSGIPLTERAWKILKPLVESRKGSQALLWPSQAYWSRNAWERTALALGKQDDHLWLVHILRHTCASRLVQRNIPLRTVMEWMDHSQFSTTLRYAHLSPKSLLDARDALA